MIVCLRTVAVPATRRAASEMHQAVEYRPITRYDVAACYLNLAGLAHHEPIRPTEEEMP
jgi:hypothetical protein